MNVEVLGNVQDGGVPHLGCNCDLCENARDNPSDTHFINSIILKENDDESSTRYLFGASPDIRHQIDADFLDGIFISDTHLGDITGLLFLGKHAMGSSGTAVYCNDDVEDFLMKNDPYRLMIDHGHLELIDFEIGDEEDVQGVTVEARKVINDGDYGDTLSFMIRGEEKTLYYATDLDRWTRDAEESVKEADIAIIDGCFWSSDEIDRYDEVPHPTVQQTMDKFEDADTEIYFTNMNHTNPILREDSEQRKEMEDRGFEIAEQGMELEI